MIASAVREAPRKRPPPGVPERPWVLRPAVRVGFAVAIVGLFAASYTQPLWVTRFTAPQYPGGLHLEVYMDRVSGDTREVDLLNHYVGLRPIGEMATFERAISRGVLVAMCILAVVASLLPCAGWQILLVLPLVLFPLVAMIDLWAWLWYAGHSLDPSAPMGMSVKPFTPKLFGTQHVANFDVTSGLGTGAWLQLAGAVLLAGAAAVGWRLSKRHAL